MTWWSSERSDTFFSSSSRTSSSSPQEAFDPEQRNEAGQGRHHEKAPEKWIDLKIGKPGNPQLNDWMIIIVILAYFSAINGYLGGRPQFKHNPFINNSIYQAINPNKSEKRNKTQETWNRLLGSKTGLIIIEIYPRSYWRPCWACIGIPHWWYLKWLRDGDYNWSCRASCKNCLNFSFQQEKYTKIVFGLKHVKQQMGSCLAVKQ